MGKKYTAEELQRIAKELQSLGDKVSSSASGGGVPFVFLPKGEHVVRMLPDSEGKLISVAKVHTLKVNKTYKNDKGEEEERTRYVTVLCGKGPEGSGYCPICEYANEGEKDSWAYARYMAKFPVYVHKTDASVSWKDEVQWKRGKLTVAIVTRKDLTSQLLSNVTLYSQNLELLGALLNPTEKSVYGTLIKYPAGKKASPIVSMNPAEVVPPLDEDSLPEWYSDFNLDAVYVDFSKVPSEEELTKLLNDYLQTKGLDARNTAKATTPEEVSPEKGPSSEKVDVVEPEQLDKSDKETDTPPWEDEGGEKDKITRTAATKTDKQPDCFGNFDATNSQCQNCAYSGACIEASLG